MKTTSLFSVVMGSGAVCSWGGAITHYCCKIQETRCFPLDKQTDGWTYEQTDGWTHEHLNRQMDGRMNRQMDGLINRQMDGCINRQMDGLSCARFFEGDWKGEKKGDRGSRKVEPEAIRKFFRQIIWKNSSACHGSF